MKLKPIIDSVSKVAIEYIKFKMLHKDVSYLTAHKDHPDTIPVGTDRYDLPQYITMGKKHFDIYIPFKIEKKGLRYYVFFTPIGEFESENKSIQLESIGTTCIADIAEYMYILEERQVKFHETAEQALAETTKKGIIAIEVITVNDPEDIIHYYSYHDTYLHVFRHNYKDIETIESSFPFTLDGYRQIKVLNKFDK